MRRSRPSFFAWAFRKLRGLSTIESSPTGRSPGARRIAFAWPVNAERKNPWLSSVISLPSSALISFGREATTPNDCIPLQPSSLDSAQTGTSCRQSASGRSSVASCTICSRKPRRSGGTAFPWNTFQVRTRRANGGLV